MHLTLFTEHSLRVLLYLVMKGEELATITETAETYDISRDHLVKVVNNLANRGLIKTIRGKGGGMTLARSPDTITLGDVVRVTEPNMNIIECFLTGGEGCPIQEACDILDVMKEAHKAFMEVLDRYSLTDVLGQCEMTPTQLRLYVRKTGAK